MATYLDRIMQQRRAMKAAPVQPSRPSSPELFELGAGGLQRIGMKSAYYGDSYSTTAYQQAPLSSSAQGYAIASVVSVWAFRAIEVRATAFNRLPVKVIDESTGEEVIDHPFIRVLKRNPSRLQYRYMWSRMIWGETFFRFRYNKYNLAAGLEWLNNIGMEVEDGTGVITGYSYTPPNGGSSHQFTPEQIAMMVEPNPLDDIRGLSRFESVLSEIGIDRDVARTTRAFYANDARPSLLLIPDGTWPKRQAEEFMEFWNANLRGPKNAGKPALGMGIRDVKEINRPPSVDDVTLRESVRREIAAAFGVPLSMVGAWDDATYQSLPQQRRSFYEETVIPDAELASDEWTQKLLPQFDSNPDLRVVFDTSGILALMEDQSMKEQMLTARLLAGGMTFNEYRKAINLEELPNGDVFFMPAGVTVVKADELHSYAPAAPANPLGMMSEAKADEPEPEPPAPKIALPDEAPIKAAPRVGLPAPVVMTPAPDQANLALYELRAWHKRVKNLGNKFSKALDFDAPNVDGHLQEHIRDAIKTAPDNGTARAVIQAAIKIAELPIEELPAATPEEYEAYWHNYDELMEDVGDSWLVDYMNRIRLDITPDVTPEDLQAQLQAQFDALMPELIAAWVGTEEDMGLLTKIILAGMAAGNDALQNPDVDMNPVKAELVIDWELLSSEAIEFARDYVGGLIAALNQTTQKQVQAALVGWIESGAPLSELIDAIGNVILNQDRAYEIASTESTRAYYQGSKQRWQNAGVTMAKWMTVRDDKVCPICQPLHGQIALLSQGWQYGSVNLSPPAHTRCRCFARPVLEGLT